LEQEQDSSELGKEVKERSEEFTEASRRRFPGDQSHSHTSFTELFPGDSTHQAEIKDSEEEEGFSSDSRDSSTPFRLRPAEFPEVMEQDRNLQAEPQVEEMAAAHPTQMPATRPHTAPKFSPDPPRELMRYFEELDTLMEPALITVDIDKKKQAVRYLDMDTAETWKALVSYSVASRKSYKEWKKEVTMLYPGVDEEKRWTIADMDKLVGERARIGIHSNDDFAAYYRTFYTITSFLKEKGRISGAEQSRAFLRGISLELWQRIERHLEIQKADHDPDKHWELSDVKTAGNYVLHSMKSPINMAGNTAAPAEVKPKVKMEEVMVGMIEKLMVTLMNTMGGRVNNANRAGPGSGVGPGCETGACNFCGVVGHYIPECEEVEAYIKEGKIRKNVDGKIVLSMGAFCPRTIPGRWIKEHVDEWHRCNPGQLIKNVVNAAAVAGGTAVNFMYDCMGGRKKNCEDVLPEPIKLITEERINQLYGEILTLKKEKFNGIEITRNKGFKPAGPVFHEREGTKEPPKETGRENAVPSGSGTGKGKAKEIVEGAKKITEVMEDPFVNIPEA
jgi:hypothetical protein